MFTRPKLNWCFELIWYDMLRDGSLHEWPQLNVVHIKSSTKLQGPKKKKALCYGTSNTKMCSAFKTRYNSDVWQSGPSVIFYGPKWQSACPQTVLVTVSSECSNHVVRNVLKIINADHKPEWLRTKLLIFNKTTSIANATSYQISL